MMMEYTAGISLTERCNLRCKHCYIGQKELWKNMKYPAKEISIGQLVKLIPILKEMNVKRINLGGGETPLHKNFITVVEEIHKSGMKVGLTTNGTTYKVYSNHLGLFNDIGVSIDFPDERHSTFRGNEKVFSNAVDTLNKLVENEVRTELVTCIMSINYKDMQGVYKLCQEIGVDMWRLNRFHSSKNDLQRFRDRSTIQKEICKINDYLSCSAEQMKSVFEFLGSITPIEQDYVIPDPLFRTYVGGKGLSNGSPSGKMAFRIKTNGDVTPNVFTDCIAGNIFIDNPSKILAHESFQSYRNIRPKGKCKSCVNYDSCQGGDHTDSYLLTGDLEAPDPYCFLNPKEKKETKLVNINSSRFIHESYLGTIYIPIKNRH